MRGNRVDPETVPHSLQRVVVVGSSCAGKSTFACGLAAALGHACVELDALFWAPHWQPRPTKEFHRLTQQAAAADTWVVEGNYRGVREILWPRATTVVWLNYGFATVLWRAVRRTIRRIATREVHWHGNRESFRRSFLSRESILVWVVKTFLRRRCEFEALRASGQYPQLAWVELQRPGEAANYLRSAAQGKFRHG